jgi:hypothetical protein
LNERGGLYSGPWILYLVPTRVTCLPPVQLPTEPARSMLRWIGHTLPILERIEGGQRVADLYLCENALRTYGEDAATLVRASGTTAAVAGGIALDAGVQEMDGIDRVVASAE